MWFLGWNGFIQIPVILICRASSFCKSEIVFPSNSPRFALLPLSDGYDSHSVYAFDCLGFLIEMELYFIHVVEYDRTFLKGNSVVVYAYAIFSYLLSANEHWFFFYIASSLVSEWAAKKRVLQWSHSQAKHTGPGMQFNIISESLIFKMSIYNLVFLYL